MTMRPSTLQHLLFALPLVLAACAGARARTNVVLPTLRAEWPRVRPLADLGAPRSGDAEAPAAIVRVEAALEDGDGPALVIAWPPVERAAFAGVDVQFEQRQIGPHGAEIAREHVKQFGRGVAKLGGER